MRRSYLKDPSKAYPRVLVLISIVLGCLSVIGRPYNTLYISTYFY